MDVKKMAKIITDWINNYCDSSSYKPKALVVGISGGIDSSVILQYCNRILRDNNILKVLSTQPTPLIQILLKERSAL